ncbi:hypothetical protein SASPL_122679 [Salvia splendens]|uniref:Uncharacterized protein n=1 Tax=Salvia splendens TaxID=180675 RepID=A0A8X8ZSH6_SALSN|nr:hypothetical protein SASPL_122679 [Salvia splendens]
MFTIRDWMSPLPEVPSLGSNHAIRTFGGTNTAIVTGRWAEASCPSYNGVITDDRHRVQDLLVDTAAKDYDDEKDNATRANFSVSNRITNNG